jgi:hypothetical protein
MAAESTGRTWYEPSNGYNLLQVWLSQLHVYITFCSECHCCIDLGRVAIYRNITFNCQYAVISLLIFSSSHKAPFPHFLRSSYAFGLFG